MHTSFTNQENENARAFARQLLQEKYNGSLRDAVKTWRHLPDGIKSQYVWQNFIDGSVSLTPQKLFLLSMDSRVSQENILSYQPGTRIVADPSFKPGPSSRSTPKQNPDTVGTKSASPEKRKHALEFTRAWIDREFNGNALRATKELTKHGVGQSVLYGFLSGRHGPGLKLLEAISKASGTPIKTILGEETEEKRRLPVISGDLSMLPEPGQVLYARPMPEGDRRNCFNCVLWVVTGRCVIHDPSIQIGAESICGYHVPGMPYLTAPPERETIYVDPKLSGLERVPGGTSCDNCVYYDDGVCHGVRQGNELAKVEARGCCTRWTGIEGKT